MTAISDWRTLPFEEIWAIDTEFYPGPGFASGGKSGDAATPLCLVALEMRSGRIIRLWQNEFGPFPPYRLDAGTLIMGYMLSAEFGSHIALGWGCPARALDPYVEFRHHANDGAVKAGDRERGFYSLDGALRYFHENGVDTAHKKEMRDRILQGPPFNADERTAILSYCEEDVRALAQLAKHIIPTIRSLPHAMMRANFQWAIAQQERRGVPLNAVRLDRIRILWSAIRRALVIEMDAAYGIYEFIDGEPHWRKHRFADYVRRQGMIWPAYADGTLDEREQTFREMAGRYPQIENLRELRYSISKLRLNDLHVGSDGRNRAVLGAYGTKTGRNAPSNSKFVFGPAKWIRFLIAPPPGRCLVHRDYCQQEVRIAAVLSGDGALLQACESGDVYLGIARQLGFIQNEMDAAALKAVRTLFKTVVLGIQYGLGARSLAMRTGVSLFEACEILARLRARFRVFEAYARSVVDHAGLQLEIGTPFGWCMKCPSGISPRTVRNFPIQSTAAEVLHVACILAERRGIEVVAPVHDAIMVEAALDRIEDASVALDRVMRDAAVIVLRGYELPTDVRLIRPGEQFYEERGKDMWDTIARLTAKLEKEEVA
ncbi:MAG: DNA polymerase I [Proteobacteria bacterium]|nr:MAG: DNA polymerase I [Pseudomonadota bacterium]